MLASIKDRLFDSLNWPTDTTLEVQYFYFFLPHLHYMEAINKVRYRP
jgi:hypothetical protein